MLDGGSPVSHRNRVIQERSGLPVARALLSPLQGRTLLCPPLWRPHGCLELHEVPDVHLQCAGVCESAWAWRAGGEEGSRPRGVMSPAGSRGWVTPAQGRGPQQRLEHPPSPWGGWGWSLHPITATCPTGWGDVPGGRGGLGGRGPGWFPGHRGCQACAELGCLPAAGRGHRPLAAGLPGVLRGPAPEPAAAAGGEWGDMCGKAAAGCGKLGRQGAAGCRSSRDGGCWGMRGVLGGARSLVFPILSLSALNNPPNPVPTL